MIKRASENSKCGESKKIKLDLDSKDLLHGTFIHILPARFGPRRQTLFEDNVTKYGGKCYKITNNKNNKLLDTSSHVTHVVTEDTIDKQNLLKICNVEQYKHAKFVKCSWLINCIKQNCLLPVKDFLIYENSELEKSNDGVSSNILDKDGKKSIPNLLRNEYSEENSNQFDTNKEDSKIFKEADVSNCKQEKDNKFIDKFACAHSSSSSPVNLNELITNELKKLSSAYESRKDTWRAVGYQKAIAAIKNYPKKIENWEEAKSIRGIGERLADKIKEILESGQLRKVKEVCDNEETKALQTFMGVWGAGPTTANNWYVQGFRTLEDLSKKANLTRHQQIGLKYYDELNERMCRAEVQEIECQVRSVAEQLKKGLQVTVCGSYRRGKETCGDVDILITHPDGVSHQNIFKPLLEGLKENDFLTDDLVIQENNGNQQKYLGVCKLPGQGRKHRRLDIIVVPYDELATALMYFTGSAHFNRSMRLLATKMGMSLSEHGLRAGIIRNGREAVTGGRLLDTPTEESIFSHLSLPYRPPSERDH